MKKTQKAELLQLKTRTELLQKKNELLKHSFDLRFKKITGQLIDFTQIRKNKRLIARINWAIHNKV